MLLVDTARSESAVASAVAPSMSWWTTAVWSASAVAEESTERTFAATAASMGAATLALAATAPAIGAAMSASASMLTFTSSRSPESGSPTVAPGRLRAPQACPWARRGRLVERRVLRGVRDGVACEVLVDEGLLLSHSGRLGPDREQVGRRSSVDRCGDVEVRGDGEVHRRCQVQCQVDVGVEVQEGEDLLGGEGGRGLPRQVVRSRVAARSWVHLVSRVGRYASPLTGPGDRKRTVQQRSPLRYGSR